MYDMDKKCILFYNSLSSPNPGMLATKFKQAVMCGSMRFIYLPRWLFFLHTFLYSSATQSPVELIFGTTTACIFSYVQITGVGVSVNTRESVCLSKKIL